MATKVEVQVLTEQIRKRGNLPRHIAVIMDGNGRWARKRGLPRIAGHRAGRHAVRETVRSCAQLGIQALTLYTFSPRELEASAATRSRPCGCSWKRCCGPNSWSSRTTTSA